MRSIVLVLLAACGPAVAVFPVESGPRVPHHATSAASVEVYAHREPARPFTDVAVLQAIDAERPALIDALRRRAATIGCDAVILDTEIAKSDASTAPATDAPAWWARRHPGERTFAPARAHELDATCIVYKR